MTSLLALVLTASPLLVRVLEDAHPVRAELEARQLQCDGAPLPSRVEVVPGRATLEVGEARCAEVTAAGDVTLRLKGEPHRYPGRLRVTLVGGGLELVNEVDVEDYLPGVVEAASPPSGAPPRASLEAQAVVSRTFALASRRRHATDGYDLCDADHCQRYLGAGQSAGARAAVTATAGQVLLAGGVVLRPAFSHPVCGGHTSLAQDVLGEEAVGLAVADADKASGGARCREAPDFSWSFAVSREDLAAALHVAPEGNAVEVLRRDAAGRAIEVRAFGKRMTGLELGAVLSGVFGAGSVPSAKWTAEEVESQVRFTGAGRGHGAGLCQAGAAAMARRGSDWRAILRQYFPDARVAPAP